MYDRFILAVDPSDEARSAAKTGFDLATTLDAPVDIVHVLEGSILDRLRSEEVRTQLRRDGNALLSEYESLATDYGVEPSTHLLQGKPASELRSFAVDRPGSVIMLGRQGRDAISRTVLGGITERLLQSESVPVLVHPGTETDQNGDIKRILVPTDGSDNAAAAEPYAAVLADSLDASVHLLAVLDLQRVGGVFNAGGLDADVVERFETDLETAIEAVGERIRKYGYERSMEIDLRQSTDFEGVSGAIADHVSVNSIDMIVMGSHGRSNVRRQLLGSVTGTTLRTVDVPVLVIPRDFG